MRAAYAGCLDAACVVAFVAIGRASHDEAASVSGFFTTLWPFAVGLVVGWVLASRSRHRLSDLLAGAGVWILTVGGGMWLRWLAGQGVATSFVIVASVFLGLTLVGWRLVARFRTRRRSLAHPGDASGSAQ